MPWDSWKYCLHYLHFLQQQNQWKKITFTQTLVGLRLKPNHSNNLWLLSECFHSVLQFVVYLHCSVASNYVTKNKAKKGMKEKTTCVPSNSEYSTILWLRKYLILRKKYHIILLQHGRVCAFSWYLHFSLTQTFIFSSFRRKISAWKVIRSLKQKRSCIGQALKPYHSYCCSDSNWSQQKAKTSA